MMNTFRQLSAREKWIEMVRWLCVVPVMAVANSLAKPGGEGLLSVAAYGWGRDSEFGFWMRIGLYALRSVLVLVVGALVVPRKRVTATFVLMVAWMLSSLLTHVLVQPHPGRTNYLHWAAESLGAVLAFVLVVRRERAPRALPAEAVVSLLLLICFAGTWTQAAVSAEPAASQSPRLRLIVETDAGGDPDDEQSLVRFLLYTNEWDVEGIIANRIHARDGENENSERTGLGIVRAMIAAYGTSWQNLSKHDPRYPPPDVLQSITVPGHDDVDDGMRLILAAVDRDDPRPIWYSDWGTDSGGGKNNLRRALDYVLAERGPGEYARFKSKLRLASNDAIGEHTKQIAPPFPLWVDTFEPELNRRRWYHTFSGLTATAGGFDIERDLRTGHGPLGKLYPLNTTHRQKEGDTMTFLYLVPTGMNDPEQPTWGSWAGRYGLQSDAAGRAYYWADVEDTWHGTTNRENTLGRFAAAIQNDFAARADWCVAEELGGANHPPSVVLNGDRTRQILQLTSKSGQQVKLSAAGSNDPDGDALKASWYFYPEAGTYRGPLELDRREGSDTAFVAPTVSQTETVHVMLEVRDEGRPPLTRYRRAVVTVTP